LLLISSEKEDIQDIDMRKILLYTAILIILAGLLMLMLFRQHSPFGSSNSDFTVKPEKEITRIEFQQDGKKLILEKSGEGWMVNGKAEARKGGISFITRILTEARIKSPVSEDVFRKEISDADISPVQVKVFEGRKLLKSFRVYKTTSNRYGNIMKIKERSKPFIVEVPGYELNIGSAFTLNELYWQPYTIFSMVPSEISSVRMENFSEDSASFSIVRREGKYVLSDSRNELSAYDQSLIIRYISYFTFIPFEKWALELTEEEKKIILDSEPLFRITVISAEGSKKVLTLWKMIETKDGEAVPDTDRLWGCTDGSADIFSVRYFDIDPVLKKISYFFD